MRLVVLPLFLILSSFSAWGDTPEDQANIAAAETFVVDLTEQVFTMMENANLSEQDRRERLGKLINTHIGVDFLARLMLAREHRDAATADQLAAYHDLSRAFVVDMFIERIGELGENRLTISESKLTRRGDVSVRTQLRKKDGGLVDVDWRVRNPQEKPQIINLAANGVSLIIVKRDEFSSIARNDGFDALLNAMRQSIAGPDTASDPSED